MADNITTKHDAAWDDGPVVKSYEDAASAQWVAGVCAYLVTPGDPDVLQVVTPAAGLPVAFNTAADGSGTEKRPLVDADGHTQIDVLSSALPSGAATAAKQPALGTAGAASADVITVQGIASMTPLLVNGSAVTQPVSAASLPLPAGAATAANQSTIVSGIATLITHVDGVEAALSVLALESGGNLAAAATALAAIEAAVEGSIAVTQAVVPWEVAGGVRHDSATAAVNPTLIGGVASAAAPVDVSTDGDAVQAWFVKNGAQAMVVTAAGALIGGDAANGLDVDVTRVPASIRGPGEPTIDSYTSAAVSASANTANQQLVAAPGASKQIWVYGLVGTADTGDGSISLQDEDDTALSGVMAVVQNGGFAVSPSGNFSMPWLKLATNKALEIDTVTCGFKGALSYAIVSV